MPTSLPAVVAIGDIQQVVLVNYQGVILSVCLRAGSVISIHRDGAAVGELLNLGVGGSKDKLGAAVKGNQLHLVWGSGANVVHSRWNLDTEQFDKVPTVEFTGSRPAIAFGQGDNKLLCHYVSATGTHESRVSLDDGNTWEDAVVVESATTVQNVDVSISPLDDTAASWTNNH